MWRYSKERRLKLIAELYEWFFHHTESFEEGYGPDGDKDSAIPLGSEIAYLFGAIANDRHIILKVGRSPLYDMLTDRWGWQDEGKLPADHMVWEFIHVDKDEEQ
jgi:hypothetical protein